MPFQVSPGSAHPLGAHELPGDDGAVNFAIFSSQATAVDLCLFDCDDPDHELGRVRLSQRSGDIWHAEVKGCAANQLYGYRIHGPWDPGAGLFFNPDKLLLDPFARGFSEPAMFHPSLLPVDADSVGNGAPRPSLDDSAPHLPRCIVTSNDFDWQGDRSPATSFANTLIYELHVKGFTQLHPAVPGHLRGTYAGLANEAAIGHLLELGVTAVQLMPVHYHLDDGFLLERGLVNYWGYNTLGFFCPGPRY